MIPDKLSDESTDTDFPTSWDETQQRLESCGTHSYIEETGCLQNTRTAASFYNKLDRLTLVSGPVRTKVNTHIHPPAPSLVLHSSETQEKPALPLSCARVSQALDVMSELNRKKAGMGLIECSSEFEVAWKAADQQHNCEKTTPYAVADSDLSRTLGQTAPHTNQTSFIKAGSPNSENNGLSSSPAILHLPLHCQTQIHGRASWDIVGSLLSGSSSEKVTDSKQDRSSPTAEETNGMVVLRSTDRAVFSDHTDTRITSERSRPSISNVEKQLSVLSGVKFKGENWSQKAKEGIEEACELMSPASSKDRSFVGWFSGSLDSPPHQKREDMDAFLKPEGQGEYETIEVDGWCHLPRFPVKTSKPADKAMHTCWGLPEAEVRVWGAQILLALESLHQQGILCRDLNPRNVLLTSNGESVKQMYTSP